MRVYNSVFDPETWKEVNQESKDILADYMLELRCGKINMKIGFDSAVLVS